MKKKKPSQKEKSLKKRFSTHNSLSNYLILTFKNADYPNYVISSTGAAQE